MNPPTYTKNVFKTLAVDRKVPEKSPDGKPLLTEKGKPLTKTIKGPKWGMRQVLRKSYLVNTAHGLVGFVSEVGELLVGAREYLLGFEMTDKMLYGKGGIKEELGDCKYYLTVCSKSLKVRMPPTGRKQTLQKRTNTQGLLDLHAVSIDMMSTWKRMFYGREVDYEALKPMILEAHRLVDALTGSLLNMTPSQLMASNISKLASRYPKGTFDQADEDVRDTDKENAALSS